MNPNVRPKASNEPAIPCGSEPQRCNLVIVAEEQAVIIHLDGTTLPNAVYEQHDLATLEDELIAVIERTGAGELDGNEIGPETTTLFLYGPNAADLFSSVEPTLRANPLCQNATIIIRAGGPNAPAAEVRLAMHP